MEAEEVAPEAAEDSPLVAYRPVTIVDASEPKQLDLRIEVPVEDMARMGQREELPSGAASQGPKRTSIWTAIHPRLVDIIRQRHSTIIFVNSRRIAERLAGAINELAGEQLARAHHGSLAASQRSEIEEQLKAGRLRALVATSSLELGIDMGAVDLVVQIEAPPSVASAMQRIGRAGHHVGAASEGVIFPKYRADLVACAAVTRAMHEGLVESTRFLRNPLDVLAQQIVAIVAQPPALAGLPAAERKQQPPEIGVEEVFRLIRGAAPFSSLTRAAFTGVLDLLAGRYPSDEFADLRPRITWDRVRDTLAPREGVKMLAILNGGTIPDRGLYGVFLSGAEGKPVRVGELDEEMVFESRTGDTFILGASTWRIDEITHDRVLVSPAPGQPGKMPFWHGDNAGRPLEFGRRIGQLVRELRDMPRNAALSRLIREHDLDSMAAENLIRFLADQEIATTTVPDDRTIVIERTRDEMGDWRVCVLTPFGSRIHAPWAMAISGRIRASGGADVEAMWGDDGFVLRFPDSDAAPDPELILIDAEEATDLVLRQLSGTALFAAKFRESAARALLLPRRRAQGRAPLWQQTQASLRSAVRCLPLSFVSHSARGLPRVHARRVRYAGAARNAARHPPAQCARACRRYAYPFALCFLAALQLRSQLHLRRRCAAGRAPRPGAFHRSGAVARPAGRCRSARVAGCRCHQRSGRAATGSARNPAHSHRRRHPRSAAAHRRSLARGTAAPARRPRTRRSTRPAASRRAACWKSRSPEKSV